MSTKITPFTALTSDEDVGKVMKVALPSTKKMIKAGFTRNDSDDQGNKSGFPYLQKKNTRVLMNDFSFAMQIVANIQYALRKNKNEAENCIREMQKSNGTIRCLVSANEKKGLFHRKYVVNATKLSDSLDNENGFKGILRIVYEDYKDPDGKSVEDIITNLLKTLKTKAKRMTNWIMNGPDTLRAISGILEQTNIVTKGQLKSVEDVLKELSKHDEEDTSTQTNGGSPGPNTGLGGTVPKPPKSLPEKDSIIMPKDFEKHVDLYKKLFYNPAKAHYILHRGNKYWVPILTYDPGNGILKYIFDGQNYGCTDEELKVIQGIFEQHEEYRELDKWTTLPGFEADKNKGKWYDSAYDLSDYCNQMEQCAKKIGEYLNKKPSSVPNPEPQPKKVKLWWPNAVAQDKSTIDTYLEFFPKDTRNANKLYGIPIEIKGITGITTAYVPSTMGLLARFNSITDPTKKETIREILNGLNGWWEAIDTDKEVTSGNNKAAKNWKSGLKSHVLDKMTAAGAPAPGPIGTVTRAKSRDGFHLGADTEKKGNPKFKTIAECRKEAETKIFADQHRRFFISDATGKNYRPTGRRDTLGTQGRLLIDGNNEKIMKYFLENTEGKKVGPKFECEIIFDDIAVQDAAKEKRTTTAISDPKFKIGFKRLANGVYMCKEEGQKDLVTVASDLIDNTDLKNVLVLNAASQVTPGGAAGIHDRAAEESLCADTSLFLNLTAGDNDEFYVNKPGFTYIPGKISIAKGVKIFPKDAKGNRMGIKNADEVAGLKSIDIMSHASPNFNEDCCKQCQGTDTTELMRDAEKANKAIQDSANQMIKAAVKGGYQAFVINNLGGGAFKNSIVAWARAWKQAIDNFGRNLVIVLALFDYDIGYDDRNKQWIPQTNDPNIPKGDFADAYYGKKVSYVYEEIFK